MSVFKELPSIEEVKERFCSVRGVARIDTSYFNHYLVDVNANEYGYGDTVTCVNSGEDNYITVGKQYTVVAVDYHMTIGSDPVILDDRGDFRTVNSDRFKYEPN